ncbi:COG2426 family protein [Patescibacteria group bacterium]
MHFYESWANGLSAELATLIVAIIPIAELRGAIPVSIEIFGLVWWKAYIFAVIGNMIPVFIILKVLGPISAFLSKHSKFFKRFFDWLFERTRRKFYDRHERFGDIALTFFVAIPLPITGVWTGAIAAFLFGIKYWRAISLMFIGVLISATIVTIITLGVDSII